VDLVDWSGLLAKGMSLVVGADDSIALGVVFPIGCVVTMPLPHCCPRSVMVCF
jgi:hypothetical protein